MARIKKAAAEEHGGGGGGHGGGGSGRWLVSYADFMTLMFVVFVVMFSFARVDTVKYTSLARSLSAALGPVGPDIPPLPARGQTGTAMPVISPERPGNLPDVPDWPSHLLAPSDPEATERADIPPADVPPADAEPADPGEGSWTAQHESVSAQDPLEEVADVFRGMPGVQSGLLAVALEERGIVLSVAGNLLFNPGEYAVKPEAYATLGQIAEKLRGVELPIMVNGTADANLQAGSSAAFELAALRAGAVVRYFTDTQGLPGTNFVYFGYGDGQADSDRVTIVVARKQ